jgi:hypothetical protein
MVIKITRLDAVTAGISTDREEKRIKSQVFGPPTESS